MTEEVIGCREPMGEGLYNMWLTNERIVRCKDCRMSEMSGTRCRLWRTLDLFRTPVHAYVEPNGFCKWGEPREDA